MHTTPDTDPQPLGEMIAEMLVSMRCPKRTATVSTAAAALTTTTATGTSPDNTQTLTAIATRHINTVTATSDHPGLTYLITTAADTLNTVAADNPPTAWKALTDATTGEPVDTVIIAIIVATAALCAPATSSFHLDARAVYTPHWSLHTTGERVEHLWTALLANHADAYVAGSVLDVCADIITACTRTATRAA